jgi:hypothetical protein
MDLCLYVNVYNYSRLYFNFLFVSSSSLVHNSLFILVIVTIVVVLLQEFYYGRILGLHY